MQQIISISLCKAFIFLMSSSIFEKVVGLDVKALLFSLVCYWEGGSGYCKFGWSKYSCPSGRSATFLVSVFCQLLVPVYVKILPFGILPTSAKLILLQALSPIIGFSCFVYRNLGTSNLLCTLDFGIFLLLFIAGLSFSFSFVQFVYYTLPLSLFHQKEKEKRLIKEN